MDIRGCLTRRRRWHVFEYYGSDFEGKPQEIKEFYSRDMDRNFLKDANARIGISDFSRLPGRGVHYNALVATNNLDGGREHRCTEFVAR